MGVSLSYPGGRPMSASANLGNLQFWGVPDAAGAAGGVRVRTLRTPWFSEGGWAVLSSGPRGAKVAPRSGLGVWRWLEVVEGQEPHPGPLAALVRASPNST